MSQTILLAGLAAGVTLLGVVMVWSALASASSSNAKHAATLATLAAVPEAPQEQRGALLPMTGRRVSTEFTAEPTVMVPAEVFEDICTDVAEPRRPTPTRDEALGAAIDALILEIAAAPARRPVAPPPIPAPARRRFVRGSVVPVRSLLAASSFDLTSTVEGCPMQAFDDSTAVDEVTCLDAPPWSAPMPARFAN